MNTINPISYTEYYGKNKMSKNEAIDIVTKLAENCIYGLQRDYTNKVTDAIRIVRELKV